MLKEAFNLEQWIEQHLPTSLGAIGNKEMFKHSDFIVQVIKGPNARNDYHIDPFDEIFYQLHGVMFLHTLEEGRFVRHRIDEGEIFFLPKQVFHSPRRPPGSVTLVLERPRPKGSGDDGIAWFCEDGCGALLYSNYFWCEDIEVTIKQEVEKFFANPELRTCTACGKVLPDPTKTSQWEGDDWR